MKCFDASCKAIKQAHEEKQALSVTGSDGQQRNHVRQKTANAWRAGILVKAGHGLHEK